MIRKRLSSFKPRIEALEVRWCPTTYTVLDLGTLGGTNSSAADVNESGQVVGLSTTAAGLQRGYLWQNGIMTDLGTLGGTFSQANDLNDGGQVVGQSGTGAGVDAKGNAIAHAFMWKNGVITDLGTLGPTYDHSRAFGINNAGQIVGQSYTIFSADNWLQAAFVQENGLMHDLNDLLPAGSGWTLHWANAISNNGQIVGHGYINGVDHGFLFTDPDGIFANGGGSIIDLGDLPGGANGSWGSAVNGSGQVVGGSLASTDVHAFRYSGGTMLDLGTMGGSRSEGSDVNDSGQIVGYSYITSAKDRNVSDFDKSRAFLWQNGAMTDLNKLIPRKSGWSLRSASEINNVGWVAGAGVHDGQSRAFVLVPGSSLQAQRMASAATAPTVTAAEVEPLLIEAVSRWAAAGVDTSSLAS